MSETFFPGEAEWVTSHYYDVPNQTVEFCGDIAGKSVLDVGCGDMVTDFGLMVKNVHKLTGLDLDERNPDHILRVIERLQRQQINPPGEHASRITYLHYDGLTFPFADEEFDFVFSWSAFEHIGDVPRVLAEIRRVLQNDGRVFVQVFPWYHSYWGSHLSDYISEPYFHLKHLPDWTRAQLEIHFASRPDCSAAVETMYSPYITLNRYSANRFYRDVVNAGFEVVKARILSYDLDLSQAPYVDFSDLVICGSKMLLRKKA
jgi:ubiquinone/menaquinone biosynthesis C-methylase UbiE